MVEFPLLEAVQVMRPDESRYVVLPPLPDAVAVTRPDAFGRGKHGDQQGGAGCDEREGEGWEERAEA